MENNFKNKYPEDLSQSSIEEIKYQNALKQVKRIKGFYTHLVVYIVINTAIIITKTQKIDEGESFFHAFYTAIFWGIGLLAHGLSVFLPNLILGENWEQKKIDEIIEKSKK